MNHMEIRSLIRVGDRWVASLQLAIPMPTALSTIDTGLTAHRDANYLFHRPLVMRKLPHSYSLPHPTPHTLTACLPETTRFDLRGASIVNIDGTIATTRPQLRVNQPREEAPWSLSGPLVCFPCLGHQCDFWLLVKDSEYATEHLRLNALSPILFEWFMKREK